MNLLTPLCYTCQHQKIEKSKGLYTCAFLSGFWGEGGEMNATCRNLFFFLKNWEIIISYFKQSQPIMGLKNAGDCYILTDADTPHTQSQISGTHIQPSPAL